MIHIIKRTDLSKRQETCYRFIGLFIAFLATALVILLMGRNPVEMYKNLFSGSFGTEYRLLATIEKAIPLLILSLGISVAFKMKFWNIGAEGQMLIGGFSASYFALNLKDWPPYLLLPVMLLAGVVGGALYGMIPALLKTKLGTSETLVTLMLNYIALLWINYLQHGPWREGGFPKIPDFGDNAILPTLFGIHIGWIFALVLVVVVHVLLHKSKLGYQIAVIGENPRTAGYAGIRVVRITIITMLISGAICGLAGMIQCSAVENTLTEGFTGGLGFTAVITAWLARLSAPGAIISSFAFAIFIQGSSFLQTSMQISPNVAGVLQGSLIFFVLGYEFFLQYKPVIAKKERSNKEVA